MIQEPENSKKYVCNFDISHSDLPRLPDKIEDRYIKKSIILYPFFFSSITMERHYAIRYIPIIFLANLFQFMLK